MSALNEAAGNGRFILTYHRSLTETYTEETLLKTTPQQFDKMQEKEDVKTGMNCAQQLSARYQGAACMFTNIHSSVANKNVIYQTSSNKALSKCAGCH